MGYSPWGCIPPHPRSKHSPQETERGVAGQGEKAWVTGTGRPPSPEQRCQRVGSGAAAACMSLRF